MSQIHALDTATSKQVFVECSNKALKTHDPTIHTKLDTLIAHQSVAETKLTNLQTINDTKLSAIQTFLDKDSGTNFHNTNLEAHHLTTHTKLTDGTQKGLVFGANDILGNTPRCLTVDGNGRLMTYPYEHPSSWTNTHLQSIITNTGIVRAQGILMSAVALGVGATHGTAIDARTYRSIRVYGTTVGAQDFYIMGSQDDTNYYVIKNVFPISSGEFGELLQDCPPYIKIKANGTETITLHYSLIN